jgi:DNA-binding response OmpR family regulator/signal transduction histidine kinase
MVKMIADRLSLLYLEEFLSQSQPAVFLVDSKGLVVYANESLVHLAGIEMQHLIGQSYKGLLSPFVVTNDGNANLIDDFELCLECQDRLLKSTIHIHELVSCHLQFEIFPLFASSSDIVGGCIIRAIDDQREEQAHQHRALLDFTSGLRSELVSIIGQITLLSGEDYHWENTERQGVLKTLNGQVRRLIGLLENVRDAAQIQAAPLNLDCKPVDLKQIILRVAQGLSSQMAQIDLLLDIPDDLPMIAADAPRLSRAFRIMIGSILGLAAGQRVEVTAYQSNKHIQVDLSYQGTNLSTPFEESKFAQLFQAHPTVSSSPYNLELGLFVAQHVVEAHGGSFTIERQTDSEITVCLTIPNQQSADAIIPPHSTCGEASSPLVMSQSAKTSAKILLVEDDQQLCRFLKAQLSLNGYQVITTNEGQMALEMAVLEMPDLILLDLSLPDANGLEICRGLREFTVAPIIIIASNSSEEAMVQSLNLGADDYLLKPLRTKLLMARIQANLRRTYMSDVYENTQGKPIFAIGDIEINFAQRLVSRQGVPITLTPVEHKLIYHLVANAGRILTHEQLISKVWGPMFRQETQYLWVNISRLRAKLEDDPHNPKYILTERGVGYYMPYASDFDVD